jgi:hypothetical protein
MLNANSLIIGKDCADGNSLNVRVMGLVINSINLPVDLGRELL